MTRTNDLMGGPADFAARRSLWQRCRTIDAPDDEAGRFLDLAAFADGTLTDDEYNRVAALVANDPIARADVAVARALSAGGIPLPGGVEHIIKRASGLAAEMPKRRRAATSSTNAGPHFAGRQILNAVAQWGSLAAAIAFAGWLGFAMGSGVSLTLIQPNQPNQISDDNPLPELLDPPTGFLRDLGAGQQT
jgi:hypothetical protein